MSESTIDGFTLSRRHGGQLVCLGAGSYGVVLKAAASGGAEAVLKLNICKTTQDLETARKEQILQELPEHQHVVKILSFHEHAADTGCFSHSGTLIHELRAICVEKQQQGLPCPVRLLSPAVTDTYCVLAFELAGQQDMMSWYEEYHDAGDVPPDDRLRMAATQQASALAHLHVHGIAHHDFKAENIMITISNAGVSTKLIDFGLACRAAHGHPGFSGSKGCAAPEMWRPADYAGTPADVWSYGVLLFSLGFGVMPFKAANDSCQMFRFFTARAGGSARQQWESFPASCKTKRNDGARERHEPASNLLDLVDRCLQLTPGARPTMQQIATYLESHRVGSWYADPAPAPAASADGAVYRSTKRARGDDGSAGGQYRSLGAGADEEDAPKYTSLSAGFGDDAWPFPEDPPQPRRMGALGPADWNMPSH